MSRVQEISVALRFSGDDLDPQSVSSRLGTTPSRSALKGETLPSASGRERVAKTSYWNLQVEPIAPNEEFDDQVRRLFNQLTPDKEVWCDLAGRFAANLFVGLFLNDTNEGLVIGHETLRAIVERGLEIQFDLYGPSDD